MHDAPGVPAGDIITVSPGDAIAINSVAFEVVSIDGSGNGTGIVKLPMFGNAKLGVEFQQISVAKGGCVVKGQAVLNSVDVALLSEHQRQKLAQIYKAYNQVLDVADALTPEIAQTINSLTEFIQKLKGDVARYVGGKADARKMKVNFKAAQKYARTLLADPALSEATRTSLQAAYTAALTTKDFFCSGKPCQDTVAVPGGKGPSGEWEEWATVTTPLCEENKASLLALNEALEKAQAEKVANALIGAQLVECLTAASLDIAFYYTGVWISMRFDDAMPAAQQPALNDFEAITHYKEFSWGEAFTSAGISCVGAMLPPFLAPNTARLVAVGLSALAGAATGFATETVKQYELAEKRISPITPSANKMDAVRGMNWQPVLVNTLTQGALTGGVTYLTTSSKFKGLVGVIKRKLNLSDLSESGQVKKVVDYLKRKFGRVVRPLLSNAGELRIGTFNPLFKQNTAVKNGLTAHHIPSDGYMKNLVNRGILNASNYSRNEGLCILVESSNDAGNRILRHNRTKTFLSNFTRSEREVYYALSPRDALEFDINDLREIYKADGVYSRAVEGALQDLITQTRTKYGNIFN